MVELIFHARGFFASNFLRSRWIVVAGEGYAAGKILLYRELWLSHILFQLEVGCNYNLLPTLP